MRQRATAVISLVAVLSACGIGESERGDVGGASVTNEGRPPPAGPGAFTPLTLSVITPPSPLPGSDDRTHLAAELLITNTAPRDVTLVEVSLADAADPGRVVERLRDDALRENTVMSGDLALQRTVRIPAFATALVTVNAVVDSLPSGLVPRVIGRFDAARADQPPYVSIFPDEVDETLPAMPVLDVPPLVLAPPLTGGKWAALNACCDLTAHRGAVLGRDGRLVAPERYAIDFARIGDDGQPFTGPQHTLDTDLSYGADVLAVADATVVEVTDDLPDQPLGQNPEGYGLDELAGNRIVLQLAPNVYALYAHNEPGSPEVSEGDRVKQGQVLARLGNSGNSTAPHLHFHLMNAPQPLNSDGLPFVFDAFDVFGAPQPDGQFAMFDNPKPMIDRYPLIMSLIAFRPN